MGSDDQQQQTPPADETPSVAPQQSLTPFTAQAEERIRRVWLNGQWYFSIIDVIAVLTDSANPRRYWTDMKGRIQDEGFVEVSAKCVQLKMRSPDGKMRTTDAADRETLLRIIQSIPSPKAEPFRQWLARVGEERLREEEQPSLAVARLSKLYARKGYTDDWIGQRVKKILVRGVITAEWLGRGARTGKQIAELTTEVHEGTFDVTPGQHLIIKDLPPNQNLQDSMTGLELALSSLAEETARVLHQERDSQGMDELRRDAHEAGEVGGVARREVEARIGHPVVSATNYKQLRQERQRQLQAPLFLDEGTGAEE